MKKLITLFGFAFLTACAQFTTSQEERSELSRAADRQGQQYIQCVSNEASRMLDVSTDAAFVARSASNGCQPELESYKTAQTALLDTEYMMIDDKLEESVKNLEKQSETVVLQLIQQRAANPNQSIVAGPASSQRPAPPRTPPAGQVSSSSSSQIAAPVSVPAPASPPPVASGSFIPAFDQRVYLDCMEDQARKYVRLNETAAAIAEVAASRCRTHLTGNNQPTLEQEGRALVMGTVFDARLSGQR